eukprot:COSAG05_NODE_1914_length_3840_cov_5.230687_2_plen_709_part_00
MTSYTPIAQFIDTLENNHGPVARRIDVEIDPETGRKLCCGEKNNLTQEQIAADRGSGNTWSIALKHCPGLVCVDFDQKDLENSALWALLTERDCLRVETQKGWHVYVATAAPEGVRELNVGGDVKVDLLVSQRNVWESEDRVLTGALIDVDWAELSAHLNLEPKRKLFAGPGGDIPPEIASWLSATFDEVGKVTVKQDTRQKKQKQGNKTIITESVVTCSSICVGCEACPAGGVHTNHQYVDCCRDEDGKLFSVSLRCTSPTCEFTEDRTAEALNYDQVLVWNKRVSYIESTSVFIYNAPEREPVQVASDKDISNTMSVYSALSLADWLKHPACSRYYAIGFYPKLDPTPDEFPAHDYNLFRGMRIPRDKAVAGDTAALLDHIHNVLCAGNREHSDFFLNCLAQMVQTPWKKLNTATVLISEEGAGKSVVFQHFMAKILGPQCFLSESRADALFGTYNGCLSGKVCVVAEELLWAGSHRDAGILKDMLTSETLSLNDKYQKRWTERNFANVFVLTNNSWAIQAGMMARRFFVLRPKDTFSGAQTAESRAYFDKLLAVDPAAFAHNLYTRDLTGFNSRQPPLTDALVDQKKQSMSPIEAVLYECLQREYVIQTGNLWHDPMARSDVYNELKNEFSHIRNFPTSPQCFWADMKRTLTAKDGECLLYDMYHGQKVQLDGKRTRWVSLPPLDQCRDWWCTHKFVDSWGRPDP